MVALLEEAVERIRCLAAEEQEWFAALIIEGLEQKARDDAFDALLADHPEGLDRLVKEALREIEAGLTRPLDPDQL